MKKLFVLPLMIVALAALFMVGGCKKDNNLNESWTWKGTAYTATSCTVGNSTTTGYGANSSLTVQNGSNIVQINFFGALPTTSGIDTVESWGNAVTPTELTISMGVNGATYQSTGGSGTNSLVQVTVSNGTVTVSSLPNNPVELANANDNFLSDSSGLVFSIVQ